MKNWLFLLVSFLLFSCARVGSPVGGPKDTLAPKFLGSNIDSARVNVSTDLRELRLDFDEYVTLKEVSRNLIISPPIKKMKRIIPSNLGNKYILLQWEEELLPNTTYNFNFGNAIADLNEGNILPYFNYAFSTGSKLDDLYISGLVSDALQPVDQDKEPDTSGKNSFVIGLYKDTDSLNYQEKPYYITRADPDGYFELNYLSPGKYRVLAFKDENQNSAFDAGKESVAFRQEAINLTENISGMQLKVYPSRKRLRFVEGKEMPGGLTLIFEGKPQNVTVTPQTEKLSDYRVSHVAKSDTVQIWFDAKKLGIGQTQNENLKFTYKADTLEGTASVFYRMNAKDELALSGTGDNLLAPNRDFTITSNYPVTEISAGKWTLKQDSTNIDFSAEISKADPHKILVQAPYLPGKKYQLNVPSGTVQSYYASNLKAYQFNFEGDKAENYGSLTINLQNAPPSKFWVELLDEQNKVKYTRYTDAKQIKFTEIKPGRYHVRMLADNNGNGVWDETDFAAQTVAEDAYLFEKQMEIRPLWENVESWDVNSGAAPASPESATVPPGAPVPQQPLKSSER